MKLPYQTLSTCTGASRVTQCKESTCQCRSCRRCRFAPSVGKIPWRRKWQPTPVFLPGESHGQRNMVGHPPQVTKRGHKKLDTTESLKVHSLFTSLLAAFLLFETLNFPRLPSLLAESSMAHPISQMAVLPR